VFRYPQLGSTTNLLRSWKSNQFGVEYARDLCTTTEDTASWVEHGGNLEAGLESNKTGVDDENFTSPLACKTHGVIDRRLKLFINSDR
jgi:hypothetical protein